MTTATQLDIFAADLPAHAGAVSEYTAAGLTLDAAQGLEVAAARIISIGRRSVVEIGQELLQARETAQHGTWTPFLKRCGMAERTAANYMNIARDFGDKPAILAALPPTALYALAAPNADPAVVGEIIAEVEAGITPTVDEVHERLRPRIVIEPVPAQQQLAMTTTPLELAIEGHDPRVDAPPPAPVVPPTRVTPQTLPAPARMSPPLPVLVPAAPPVVPQPLQLPAAPVVDRERQVVELFTLAALLEAAANQVMKEVHRRYLVLEGEGAALTTCRDGSTTITLDEAAIRQAAELFIQAPGVKGAVAMLAMQARALKPADEAAA